MFYTLLFDWLAGDKGSLNPANKINHSAESSNSEGEN